MKTLPAFEIIELTEFKGEAACIYSIALGDDEDTLFDHFLAEYDEQFRHETEFIVKRLKAIVRLGARFNYFREKSEGKYGEGDGVEALFDEPEANLRLYCIKYGSVAIILGGGGYKPKEVRRFQDDSKLKYENYLLRDISKRINQAFKERELWWEGNRLAGKLRFDENE